MDKITLMNKFNLNNTQKMVPGTFSSNHINPL